MKIFLRVILALVAIILIITIIAVCFMNFWKPFGDIPDKEDKNLYKRAANYDFEKGKCDMSECAKKILARSEYLERIHGK